MTSPEKPEPGLGHIQKLAAEEHRLLELKSRDATQEARLKEIQVELDQSWDLLRQRRALRETGGNPADAHLRPPDVVEKYIG
jgi:hypothetical protein